MERTSFKKNLTTLTLTLLLAPSFACAMDDSTASITPDDNPPVSSLQEAHTGEQETDLEANVQQEAPVLPSSPQVDASSNRPHNSMIGWKQGAVALATVAVGYYAWQTETAQTLRAKIKEKAAYPIMRKLGLSTDLKRQQAAKQEEVLDAELKKAKAAAAA